MIHKPTMKLDHQRGGWFATCPCGWKEKRPHWYKDRSVAVARLHVELMSAVPDTDALAEAADSRLVGRR